MSVTFQRSFGPSFGHSLSKPVSGEIPFRCGPRHCGQSLATTDRAIDNPRKPRIPNEHFIMSECLLANDRAPGPQTNSDQYVALPPDRSNTAAVVKEQSSEHSHATI